MPSKITKLSTGLAVLVGLVFTAPAFAQSLPPNGGDPFSGAQAVDSDEMSAVSGELASAISAGVSASIGTNSRNTGAQNGGGVPSNAVGATPSNISTSASHDFANQGSATVTITNNNYGGSGGTGGLQ